VVIERLKNAPHVSSNLPPAIVRRVNAQFDRSNSRGHVCAPSAKQLFLN